jgi:hypothetical protein
VKSSKRGREQKQVETCRSTVSSSGTLQIDLLNKARSRSRVESGKRKTNPICQGEKRARHGCSDETTSIIFNIRFQEISPPLAKLRDEKTVADGDRDQWFLFLPLSLV